MRGQEVCVCVCVCLFVRPQLQWETLRFSTAPQSIFGRGLRFLSPREAGGFYFVISVVYWLAIS